MSGFIQDTNSSQTQQFSYIITFKLLCLTGICILYEYEKHNGMTNVKQVSGACECGNEPSCSIICGEFLD